jgi:hypothetical protein
MDSNLQSELSDRDQFIIKYGAALTVGLSREQFAQYMNMAVDTVRRKRLRVMDATGLNLQPLELSGKGDICNSLFERFEKAIYKKEKGQAPQRIGEYGLNKRYVITAAQNATPVNDGFLAAILNFCDVNDAELLVIPLRYRNATSIWTNANQEQEWWHPDVQPYVQGYSRKLGKHLEYMGHIPITPTMVEPLSGLFDITGLDSGIFGHTAIQLLSVATPSRALPKILSTTGTLTEENFTDSKAGHKGAFHHSFAAMVVEIDADGHHHLRHIHWNADDSGFYDLDSFYTATTVDSGIRALGLVTGDTHAEFIDDDVAAATYIGEDSICGRMNPRTLVWHDVEDFYRRNHHHKGNDVVAYAKHHFGKNNVEEGLQVTADLIDKYSHDDQMNVIVKSNHDEAFDRWLREANPKEDMENCKFYYYMKYHQMESIKPKPESKSSACWYDKMDPFKWWCSNPDEQRGLSAIDNTIFLDRDESYEIADIEVGFHGDIGSNGSRGSVKGYSKIGPKVVIGHSHSPGIKGGAYQVGLSSKLDLEYKSGPSSWLHTHCLIYPDGSRTLLHIIDGKYTTL